MDLKESLNLVGKVVEKIIKCEALNVKEIPQKGANFKELAKKIHHETKNAKVELAKVDRSIQAYFIGPRGQNIDFFTKLIQKAINSHLAARQEYQMEDSRHITRKMKNQESFHNAQDKLEQALSNLLTKLKDLTPPFFSSRYFGHMIWQTTIPSIVANFATILYNPNNCAFEASPITTLLQIQVMKQFADVFGYPKMLGFSAEKNNSSQSSWGHLTCGGTIANCQALWAARNCRFLSLSVRKYVQSIQNNPQIKKITVVLANGTSKALLDLTGWQILNISNQQGTNLYDRCFENLNKQLLQKYRYYEDQYNQGNLQGQELEKYYQYQNQYLNQYNKYQKQVSSLSIGERGLLDMYDWIQEINVVHPEPLWGKKIPKPITLGSATAHYSLKKSLSILGLGKNAYQSVIVDLDSRICLNALRQRLDDCVQKKITVLAVIAIVGTTEQSTVDNVSKIISLREQYAKNGLYFHVHIDGAYGGYFVCMLREKQANQINSFSSFVNEQLQAFSKSDSITFDPHKTGYVPYSCGGIIYRNNRLRDNLSFSAPYIYTGAEPNMAIYGVEGSKPGSSVSSVYLSLQVLPLVRGGHGSLLQRTLKNTKVFTASLYTVVKNTVQYVYEKGTLNQKFQCLLLPRLYCQKQGKPELREQQLQVIQRISKEPIAQIPGLLLTGGQDLNNYYYNLGPDLNIVCFGLNFFDKEKNQMNRSLKKYNEFNRAFIKLSKPVGTDISVRMKDLYVSQTQINRNDYGAAVFDDFLQRHNLQNDGQDTIVLIRSTIMNAFFTEISETGKQPPNAVFVRELVENGCETLLYLKWR